MNPITIRPSSERLRRFAGVAIAALLAAGVTAASAQAAGAVPQPRLPTVTLSAGMHQIAAEVAAEPRQRERGLMARTSMATHEGMLFAFEEPAPQCFWMRNTLLPLTIAFLDDDGRIVNLADMKPMDESTHCSAKPVRFALEMNQGWFAKRGLKAGSKLTGAPFGTAR